MGSGPLRHLPVETASVQSFKRSRWTIAFNAANAAHRVSAYSVKAVSDFAELAVENHENNLISGSLESDSMREVFWQQTRHAVHRLSQ
jgi:hypothetical protein